MFLLHWPPCVFRYCYSIWLESQISISLYPCCCHIKRYPILSWLFKWYPQYLDRNTDRRRIHHGSCREGPPRRGSRNQHRNMLQHGPTLQTPPGIVFEWTDAFSTSSTDAIMIQTRYVAIHKLKTHIYSQCWSWKHCLCHQSMCTCQPSSMAKTFLPWSHAAEFHPWYIPWECTNSWTFRT